MASLGEARPNSPLTAVHQKVEADANERKLRLENGRKFRYLAGETVYLYGPLQPDPSAGFPQFPIRFEPGTVATPILEFDTLTGKVTTYIEAQLIEDPYGGSYSGASFSKLDLVTQAENGTQQRTGVEIEAIGRRGGRNLIEETLPSSTELEQALEVIKSFPQRYLAAGITEHNITDYVNGTYFAIVAHS